MKDRKMVPVGEEEHGMLREISEYFNRSMTKQVEWLIKEEHRKLLRDKKPLINYTNTEVLIKNE